jgi:hypothetical protein
MHADQPVLTVAGFDREEAFAADLRARVQAQREQSLALRRIRADYREMPGLRVTVKQGARLWSLPIALCESLLDELVAEGFLVRSGEHFRLP